MAERTGCRPPVVFIRMGRGNAVAGVARLVGAAAVECSTVAMLAVGKAVDPTRARVVAGNPAVVAGIGPRRRKETAVRMADDAVAQGCVEATAGAGQVEGLGRTGGVGAADMADSAYAGIGGIGRGMAGASGRRGSTPGGGGVRGIVEQAVASQHVHTGGQGSSPFEERKLGAAVAVAIAAGCESGGAHRATRLGLCSVVDRSFPCLGRDGELGGIVVAGRSVAHRVVEAAGCAADRHRRLQALIVDVAAGAGGGILRIGVGMEETGGVADRATPGLGRMGGCCVAGEAADSRAAAGQGLPVAGFAQSQSVTFGRVAFGGRSVVGRIGPWLAWIIFVDVNAVAEGVVEAAGSTAGVTGQSELCPQVGAAGMALGAYRGIALVNSCVACRAAAPRLG